MHVQSKVTLGFLVLSKCKASSKSDKFIDFLALALVSSIHMWNAEFC